MEQPRRIDRWAETASMDQTASASARRLSVHEQIYLRGIINLITIAPDRSSAFGSGPAPLDDLWVERSMLPLERSSSRPPNDDQDSPGLPIGDLVGGAASTVRFLVGEGGSGKTAASKYLSARL